MSKKVYIEGHDMSLYNMFTEEGFETTESLFEADLICLEGGNDVNPALYGQRMNGAMQPNQNLDLRTFGILEIASCIDTPVVGICRGSQALCVYEGGSLKQHIDNHCRWHDLEYKGSVFEVSSSHHQESVPDVYETKEIIRAPDGTVEIVIYKSGDIGFQPHPEYHEKGHPCRELFFQLINETCF